MAKLSPSQYDLTMQAFSGGGVVLNETQKAIHFLSLAAGIPVPDGELNRGTLQTLLGSHGGRAWTQSIQRGDSALLPALVNNAEATLANNFRSVSTAINSNLADANVVSQLFTDLELNASGMKELAQVTVSKDSPFASRLLSNLYSSRLRASLGLSDQATRNVADIIDKEIRSGNGQIKLDGGLQRRIRKGFARAVTNSEIVVGAQTQNLLTGVKNNLRTLDNFLHRSEALEESRIVRKMGGRLDAILMNPDGTRILSPFKVRFNLMEEAFNPNGLLHPVTGLEGRLVELQEMAAEVAKRPEAQHVLSTLAPEEKMYLEGVLQNPRRTVFYNPTIADPLASAKTIEKVTSRKASWGSLFEERHGWGRVGTELDSISAAVKATGKSSVDLIATMENAAVWGPRAGWTPAQKAAMSIVQGQFDGAKLSGFASTYVDANAAEAYLMEGKNLRSRIFQSPGASTFLSEASDRVAVAELKNFEARRGAQLLFGANDKAARSRWASLGEHHKRYVNDLIGKGQVDDITLKKLVRKINREGGSVPSLSARQAKGRLIDYVEWNLTPVHAIDPRTGSSLRGEKLASLLARSDNWDEFSKAVAPGTLQTRSDLVGRTMGLSAEGDRFVRAMGRTNRTGRVLGGGRAGRNWLGRKTADLYEKHILGLGRQGVVDAAAGDAAGLVSKGVAGAARLGARGVAAGAGAAAEAAGATAKVGGGILKSMGGLGGALGMGLTAWMLYDMLFAHKGGGDEGPKVGTPGYGRPMGMSGQGMLGLPAPSAGEMAMGGGMMGLPAEYDPRLVQRYQTMAAMAEGKDRLSQRIQKRLDDDLLSHYRQREAMMGVMGERFTPSLSGAMLSQGLPVSSTYDLTDLTAR